MQAQERADQSVDEPTRVERAASPGLDVGPAPPTIRGLDPSLTPRHILSLQSMAGNAAVSRLVAGRASAPDLHVQREPFLQAIKWGPEGRSDSNPATTGPVENEVEAAASEGAEELRKGQAAAPSLVLRMGNDRDISIAEGFLQALERNQPLIEAGAGGGAARQGGGRIAGEVVHGEEHKTTTQVPPEAIGTNRAVMTDLELYLAQGRRLSTGTSQFKEHYRVLLTDYGRLEGIAKNYAGMSLQEVNNDAGADALVENAAGAGGQSTEDLSATFNEMLKNDPGVSGAQATLLQSTQRFEEMPAKLSTAMTAANSTVALFDTATVSLSVASGGLDSLVLKEAFAAAKKKLDDAKKLSGKVKSILVKGGEEGAKEGFKAAAVALAAGEGLSALGAAAAKGGPAAAAAIGKEAADKFVIEPLKEAVNSALADADAAVGVIDPAVAASLKLEAEQQKQDAATRESYKTAKATLGQASKKMRTDVEAYAKVAIEFEQRRLKVGVAFDALGAAIQTAAKTRGKAGQGKALSEMLSFLKAAEEFVVQANAVSDIGQKELTSAPPPPGSDEGPSGPQAAAEAMKKWDGKTVWWANPWDLKTADGTVVTQYSAQEGTISVSSVDMDKSDEERKGLGSAEGGEMSANAAIPEAILGVDKMKAKVLAIRTAIATKVFGSGGG